MACAVLLPAHPVLAERANEFLAFTGMKPGDKVADFMPDGGYFARLFCEVVGDAGHVYVIEVTRLATTSPPAQLPSPTVPSQNEPGVPEPAGACHNVTTHTLKSRLIPAPELHDDSDPGYVYEYWTSSPAAENFTAPEPLDVIWISDTYDDLHSMAFGAPDMSKVNTALLAALKPGGLLLIETHAVKQVRRDVTEAGFESAGELHNAADQHTVLKFRKP